MLTKLSQFLINQKLHDQRYYRFRAKFNALNLERLKSFTLIVAYTVVLFAIVPDLVLYFLFPEEVPENFSSVLFLEVAITSFMLLMYWINRSLEEDESLEKKVLLLKSFIAGTLLHGMLLSLAMHSNIMIPVFLLTCCALLAAFYWSLRRIVLFIGGAELIFLVCSFLLLDMDIWYYNYLLAQLIFLCIFYFSSRSYLELKLRDFENAEKIESQTEQLQAKSQRLRMTEHALSTLHKHSHQGIFRLEGSKGFTYANDYFAKMMGFSSATELIQQGRNFTFIPQHELEALARKLNQQGFAEGLEVEATRLDGSRFWLQFNCMVRTDEATNELVYEGSAQDISHQKKALQQALENAAKLEQAEKIANAGFYEIDISSSRFTFSAGYCAILGASAKEDVSLNDHLQFIHPNDKHEVRRILLQAIMRGEDFTLNYRVSGQNGEWKHLVSKGKVIQNERGKDFKILGTVQDVSQLRQQQEALEQSQAIIRAAFNNNNHFGIYIIDCEYRILEFNQESVRRLRKWLDLDLRKGMDVRSTMRPVTAEKFIPIFRKALAGESVHGEFKLMEDTPHEIWADVFVGPVRNAHNEVIGAVLMAADISNRKRNQVLLKNLSLVASHTDNAVMISDRKHRVEWVNEAFVRNTGYGLEEVQGSFPREFMVSEQTDPAMLQHINNCLRLGKSFNDEILLRNRQNEQKWVHLNINPVVGNSGEVEKFVSVYTDLTERKKFEQELRTAKEAAEHSAEIKDYFLSTVSHELRTPLNAVIGLAYHLLQNNPRPDQADDLQILKFSAENLLSLINDILDLSKIEAGKINIEQVQFNLKDILNSLKHTFQTQTESKGLEFKLYLHDNVPHELEGDSVRLIQIITNLLSNAIKFTHQGSIQIEIKAEARQKDWYMLEVEVSDTGIGIAEDKLQTIFNKFEQATASTNYTYGGTGLGLAITKQLVEIQGGTIWVKSTAGKGSSFGFTIPYKRSPKTDLQPLAYTYRTDLQKDLSRMHILMAEDNQINQAVAGKFLQSWGVCYDVAENGLIAVEMAAHRAYDLILMDLQMPEMDGFEATHRIRGLQEHDYRQTAIIAITAAGIAGIEQKVTEAGLSDIVLKPFKPETLLNKLLYYCPYTKESTNGMHKAQNTPLPPRLDLSGVLEVAGGDKSFLQELINLYIRQFTDTPTEIRNAAKEQDRLQLRRIFHKLRPSVLMLKIEEMSQLGESIHQQLHDETVIFEVLEPQLEKYIGLMEFLKVKLQQQAEADNLVLNT